MVLIPLHGSRYADCLHQIGQRSIHRGITGIDTLHLGDGEVDGHLAARRDGILQHLRGSHHILRDKDAGGTIRPADHTQVNFALRQTSGRTDAQHHRQHQGKQLLHLISSFYNP